MRGFEAAIQGAGLSAQQFTTLSMLSGHGERTVGQMAEQMGTDRTTMTRNLDLIATQTWIEKIDPEDRRLRLWQLTPAGREQLEAAMPEWQAWQAGLVAGLVQLGRAHGRDDAGLADGRDPDLWGGFGHDLAPDRLVQPAPHCVRRQAGTGCAGRQVVT